MRPRDSYALEVKALGFARPRALSDPVGRAADRHITMSRIAPGPGVT